MDPLSDQFITEIKIVVELKDHLLRPLVHRYLDCLIASLKASLQSLDLPAVANQTPQVYIQNVPFQTSQSIRINGTHRFQVRNQMVQFTLGELATLAPSNNCNSIDIPSHNNHTYTEMQISGKRSIGEK